MEDVSAVVVAYTVETSVGYDNIPTYTISRGLSMHKCTSPLVDTV